MKHAPLVLVCLVALGCSTPTLQQRQANWQRWQDMTRATCVVGLTDPAMPADVRELCERVAP